MLQISMEKSCRVSGVQGDCNFGRIGACDFRGMGAASCYLPEMQALSGEKGQRRCAAFATEEGLSPRPLNLCVEKDAV